MGFIRASDGLYYEGDQIHPLDEEVPKRPDASFKWVKNSWVPDPLAIEGKLAAMVQSLLDSEAQARGFDNIFTAVTYADEPAVAKFQQDGKVLRAWRSQVWEKCYSIVAAVQSGAPIPSADELLAALPGAPPR